MRGRVFQIKVSVTQQERVDFHAEAERCGLSVASWVRALAYEALRVKKPINTEPSPYRVHHDPEYRSKD